jgi:integrin alpha FG-GAP repeat containing protein 1
MQKKSLDILSIGSDQETLSVYLWNHGTPSRPFSFSVHSKLSEEDDFVYKKTFSFKHPSPIVNVIPGDFTHDGKLDLLVMSQNEIPSQLDISLYRGSPGGEFGMRVF